LRVFSLKNSRRCAILPFLLQKSRLRAQFLVRRKLRGPPEVSQGEFLKYTFDIVSLSVHIHSTYIRSDNAQTKWLSILTQMPQGVRLSRREACVNSFGARFFV